MTASARALYQAHLDVVTRAFWARSWERCAPHLKLPGTYRSPDCVQELTTVDALKTMFIEQRDGLDRMGATAYHRICASARFVSHDRIEGSHDTYILRNSTYLLAPFQSSMPLIHENGLWRAQGITTEARNADYTVVGPTLFRRLQDRDADIDRTATPFGCPDAPTHGRPRENAGPEPAATGDTT